MKAYLANGGGIHITEDSTVYVGTFEITDRELQFQRSLTRDQRFKTQLTRSDKKRIFGYTDEEITEIERENHFGWADEGVDESDD